MKNYIVRYMSDKTDFAADVVYVWINTSDIHGVVLGEKYIFFAKVNPVGGLDDNVVLSARLADVKSWRHQY